MGPYPINGVRNLFGAEPLEAFARTASRDDARFAEVPEIVSVWLRLPEDRVGQFIVSYGSAAVGEYRVSGTKGDLLLTPGFGWETGQTLTLTNEGSRKRLSSIKSITSPGRRSISPIASSMTRNRSRTAKRVFAMFV